MGGDREDIEGVRIILGELLIKKERFVIFKQKKNIPYNFNINEEHKQYTNIGDNDSKLKTYTDWERYIISECNKFTKTTRLNFVHYIKGKKR